MMSQAVSGARTYSSLMLPEHIEVLVFVRLDESSNAWTAEVACLGNEAF